jgi:hypothetical protein
MRKMGCRSATVDLPACLTALVTSISSLKTPRPSPLGCAGSGRLARLCKASLARRFDEKLGIVRSSGGSTAAPMFGPPRSSHCFSPALTAVCETNTTLMFACMQSAAAVTPFIPATLTLGLARRPHRQASPVAGLCNRSRYRAHRLINLIPRYSRRRTSSTCLSAIGPNLARLREIKRLYWPAPSS